MMDEKKIGVALLSFAHVHARGYADQIREPVSYTHLTLPTNREV